MSAAETKAAPKTANTKSISTPSLVCRLAARIALQLPSAGSTDPAAAKSLDDIALRAVEAVKKAAKLVPFLNRPASSATVARQLGERMSRSLREVRVVMSTLGDAADNLKNEAVKKASASTSVVTLRSIMAELMALHNIAPFEIDWKNRSILIPVAKNVVLHDIKFGDFNVIFHWGKWIDTVARSNNSGAAITSSSVLTIMPVTPVYCWNDSRTAKGGHYHPHVQINHSNNPLEGHLCLGSTSENRANALLGQGQLVAVMDLVHAALNSYNAGNPYRRIELWKEVPVCACCRGVREVRDVRCSHQRACSSCRAQCGVCSAQTCKQCMNACNRCGNFRCATCLPEEDMISCSGCRGKVCPTCTRACRTCKELCCVDCLIRDSNRGSVETNCQACRQKKRLVDQEKLLIEARASLTQSEPNPDTATRASRAAQLFPGINDDDIAVAATLSGEAIPAPALPTHQPLPPLSISGTVSYSVSTANGPSVVSIQAPPPPRRGGEIDDDLEEVLSLIGETSGDDDDDDDDDDESENN